MLLQLGRRRFDVTERPVVVGILNRTRDSFSDRGAHCALDRLLARAAQLVADGADALEVGARPGGVGVAEVSPAEERDLAAGTLAELRSRFDVPLAVDTTRATVVQAALAEGAVPGNDMSGFLDPGYLPAAAAAGAAGVATHIRKPPGVPDPDSVFADLLGEVCTRLSTLARAAEAAGIDREHIVLDPGIDLGKSWQQSLRLLAHLDEVATLGLPVLLAVSNKIFLRRTLDLGDAPLDVATAAACALRAVHSGSVVRVHDARIGRQAADFAYAVRAARVLTGPGTLVVRADAARLLPTACVDAVVTDPPWNLGRPYGANSDRMPDDDYVRWLGGILRQCARVSRGPVVACIGTHNAGRIHRLLDGTGLLVAGWLPWHREPGRPEAVVVAAPPGWAVPLQRLDTAGRVPAHTGAPTSVGSPRPQAGSDDDRTLPAGLPTGRPAAGPFRRNGLDTGRGAAGRPPGGRPRTRGAVLPNGRAPPDDP